MPMIEFRYRPEKLHAGEAAKLGGSLEGDLRAIIDKIRPAGKKDYGITVEGDPFGPIIHNLPDLRIYVFYHQEWHFAPDELERLAAGMLENVKQTLGGSLLRDDVGIQIRFYARTGHAGASNLR
jgi:hypothetical protein